METRRVTESSGKLLAVADSGGESGGKLLVVANNGGESGGCMWREKGRDVVLSGSGRQRVVAGLNLVSG